MVRLLKILFALGGCALLVAIALHVADVSERHDAWQRALSVNDVSRQPVMEATIPELSDEPPPPGRRVTVTGAAAITDIMAAVRPVRVADGPVRYVPEGLVFLRDTITDDRMLILRVMDDEASDWVELMPMPTDVTKKSAVRRWTPLAHLATLWHPGWAEANGPGRVVWLGLDSSVVRYRDLETIEPPYRLARHIVAGRPGGSPEPSVSVLLVVLLAFGALFCGAMAIRGVDMVAGTQWWSTRRERNPEREE